MQRRSRSRPTPVERYRDHFGRWRSGAAAPDGLVDKLLFAEVLRTLDIRTYQLPDDLRRAVVTMRLLELGMPDQRGQPWCEAAIECKSIAVTGVGPELDARVQLSRPGRPKTDPLHDLIVLAEYLRQAGASELSSSVSRRHMRIRTAASLGISHHAVLQALHRMSDRRKVQTAGIPLDLAAMQLAKFLDVFDAGGLAPCMAA